MFTLKMTEILSDGTRRRAPIVDGLRFETKQAAIKAGQDFIKMMGPSAKSCGWSYSFDVVREDEQNE